MSYTFYYSQKLWPILTWSTPSITSSVKFLSIDANALLIVQDLFYYVFGRQVSKQSCAGTACWWVSSYFIPVDNFGTVVGENPTPYGNLALWAVNGLSIVYWDYCLKEKHLILLVFLPTCTYDIVVFSFQWAQVHSNNVYLTLSANVV